MKNGTIEILDLDFEYKLWKNKLAFLRTEIDLLQDRVHVLSREHPGWTLEQKNIKLLNLQMETVKLQESNIRTQEQEMAFYAEDYPISDKHSHFTVHENIRNEIEKIQERHAEIMENIYPELCFPMRFSEGSVQ